MKRRFYLKVGYFYVKAMNDDAEDELTNVSFDISVLSACTILTLGAEDVSTNSSLYLTRLLSSFKRAGFEATIEEHRTVETTTVSEYKVKSPF